MQNDEVHLETNRLIIIIINSDRIFSNTSKLLFLTAVANLQTASLTPLVPNITTSSYNLWSVI